MIPDSFLALLINSTPWCSWACERENKREGRGRTYREEGRNRLFKTTLLSKSSLQRGHLLPMVGGILFLQQLNKSKFVLHQLFGDSQVPQFAQVHCEPIFWLNERIKSEIRVSWEGAKNFNKSGWRREPVGCPIFVQWSSVTLVRVLYRQRSVRSLWGTAFYFAERP